MKKAGLIVSMLVLCFFISEAKDKHFKRVETFPTGNQTKWLLGSLLSGIKDYNIVQYTFEAQYEIVWPVMKRVSQTFSKVGGRPVVAIDESTGRIQNGMINQNGMIGMGSGAWMDEFLMEAKKLDTKTTVVIARKIVQRGYTGSREWKTHCSNSKIENYLLTQIEDELKNYSASQTTPTEIQGTTDEHQSVPCIPSEIIGNAEILSMVEAKFTDMVIISKIKNSQCKFDTSISELIKLKKSGVSDAVVQVMTEMPSK